MSDPNEGRGIWFRVTKHPTRDIELVEVWHNNLFIATISPPPPDQRELPVFSIVSNYLDTEGVVIDIDDPPTPPGLLVPFKIP
jgi:hypothetical protein